LKTNLKPVEVSQKKKKRKKVENHPTLVQISSDNLILPKLLVKNF
jgi:hypothetical protein